MSELRDRPKLLSHSFLVVLLTISILTNIILIVKLKYPNLVNQIQLSMIPSPTVLPSDHIRGNANAKFTIIEYADYQCPFCAKLHEAVTTVMKEADVLWVYRHFPLPNHPLAAKAAEAAECAGDQGKFWEYSDALFSTEGRITEDGLTSLAQKQGLDWMAFGLCMKTGKHRADVASMHESGVKLKITATPTFFLNGKRYTGSMAPDDLRKLLGIKTH